MSTASNPIRCGKCGVFAATVYLRGSFMFCAFCAGVPMTTPLAPRPEDAAEIARLRAEVERLTRDRDLAERKAAVCREDVEISARRAESAEARVAELEAALAREAQLIAAVVSEMQSTGGGGASCKNVYAWADRLYSALLSPKPSLPDLTFDADDPLPDMKPAPIPEPKCWHCSYNGAVVVKFCMRGGCPETPKFDIGGTVKFKREPAPCGTCGDSGSGGWPCEDCGAGMPCGKCGGSGAVERDGLDEMCPDCRGGGK